MTVHECVADALQNGLGETLSELEQRRQQVLQGNRKIMLWLGGMSLLVVGWMPATGMHWGFALVAIFVIFIIAAVIISSRKAKLASLFKQEAIPELLRTASPHFCYASERHVSKTEFNHSRLFINPDRSLLSHKLIE